MNKINAANWGIATLVLGLATMQTASASVEVYLSEPGTQTSYLAGTGTTDDFGTGSTAAAATYTGNVGTYTDSQSFHLQTADSYGGAGGTGRYLVLGSQAGNASPITISLNSTANYLGIWFSAADANNGVSFYNGSTFVGRFDTGTISTLLGGSTVTAINGSTYNTSQYKGNPTTPFLGQNSSENYTYVDFIGSAGTTFDKIVLDNSGSIATGFETDNVTTAIGATVPPLTDVPVVNVPEPSQYAGMMLGLVFALVAGHRTLKKMRPVPAPVL